MAGVQAQVDFNAQWLREMRGRLGWSTTETADKARAKAREYGDSIKLSQQLVSKFENGRIKSVPRWLGYVQLAMSHHLAAHDLQDGRVWQLRLPREMKEYFTDRQAWLNDEVPNPEAGEDMLPLTEDEVRLLFSWRQLSNDQKDAVQKVLDGMISNGTLHARRHEYRAG